MWRMVVEEDDGRSSPAVREDERDDDDDVGCVRLHGGSDAKVVFGGRSLDVVGLW